MLNSYDNLSVSPPRNGTFSVATYTLEAASGEAVTVGGSLTLATRPVSARDTVLLTQSPRRTQPYPDDCPTRYAITGGGTVVRTLSDCGAFDATVTGSVLGDRNDGVFEVSTGGGVERVAYHVEGETLRTSQEVDIDPSLIFETREFQLWYGTAARPESLLRIEQTFKRAAALDASRGEHPAGR